VPGMPASDAHSQMSESPKSGCCRPAPLQASQVEPSVPARSRKGLAVLVERPRPSAWS
jgi:hypothetical protein